MNKKVAFKSLIVLSLIALSQSIELHCKYKIENRQSQFGIYYCEVFVDPQINSRNVEINDVSKYGHEGSRNNTYVTGLKVEAKNFKFFPGKIDKFFENLEVIYVNNSGLEEIRPKDLKPFIKLRLLTLSHNKIQELEKNLFQFNPKLEEVKFHNNQIQFIHPKMFIDLKSLRLVSLIENTCITRLANNKEQFDKLEIELRENCGKMLFDVDEQMRKLNTDLNELRNFVHNNFDLLIKINASKFIDHQTQTNLSLQTSNNTSKQFSENDEIIQYVVYGFAFIFVFIAILFVVMLTVKIKKNFTSEKEELKEQIENEEPQNPINVEADYEEPIRHEENIYDEIDYEKIKADSLVIIDGVEYMRMDNPNVVRYLKMTRGVNSGNS